MRESISSQVADPATGSLYFLASQTTAPVRGGWFLCRMSLRTGRVRRGRLFGAGGLTLADGYLWIYNMPASGVRPVLIEAAPATLAPVRDITLPQGTGETVSVASGPPGSVWAGSGRTLLRVQAATGRVLARAMLPPGLAVDDLSAGPALYVSAAHVVRGGEEGAMLFSYDARTGQMLAQSSGGLLRYSAIGASLTAVPGGVWASFRTGMLGLTIHLGGRKLQMITPPGPGVVRGRADSAFYWPMGETTAYGGGTLFTATEGGVLACVNPQTGAVLASERLPQSRLIGRMVVNAAARTIVALSQDDGDVVQVTPPPSCWTGS